MSGTQSISLGTDCTSTSRFRHRPWRERCFSASDGYLPVEPYMWSRMTWCKHVSWCSSSSRGRALSISHFITGPGRRHCAHRSGRHAHGSTRIWKNRHGVPLHGGAPLSYTTLATSVALDSMVSVIASGVIRHLPCRRLVLCFWIRSRKLRAWPHHAR
jgi:hypothetical protein